MSKDQWWDDRRPNKPIPIDERIKRIESKQEKLMEKVEALKGPLSRIKFIELTIYGVVVAEILHLAL